MRAQSWHLMLGLPAEPAECLGCQGLVGSHWMTSTGLRSAGRSWPSIGGGGCSNASSAAVLEAAYVCVRCSSGAGQKMRRSAGSAEARCVGWGLGPWMWAA